MQCCTDDKSSSFIVWIGVIRLGLICIREILLKARSTTMINPNIMTIYFSLLATTNIIRVVLTLFHWSASMLPCNLIQNKEWWLTFKCWHCDEVWLTKWLRYNYCLKMFLSWQSLGPFWSRPWSRVNCKPVPSQSGVILDMSPIQCLETTIDQSPT
jgi:hypothetical protein